MTGIIHYTVPKDCPNVEEHTSCPTDYVAWHEWAHEMSKTHKQKLCLGCNRWMIWIPK